MHVDAGSGALPFRTINHLSEGDTLYYEPVLRGKESRPGEIALVLVPQKIEKGQPQIIVTDPKPAGKPQRWDIRQTISIAALVYGPAGLSRRGVAKFLARDQLLVAQLADYADKTAQAERLVATLSNSESSAASVNAALNGFASEYGFAVQIDRTEPVETQAETLFATMNPQLAMYSPLASSTAVRTGQTASLATTAAALFFGSPIGLAAGGTAMLLDLRAIAFPDTQFRPSFAQALKDSDVNLCGPAGAAPAHTRVAYIWASRIPETAAPSIKVGEANSIAAKQKTPLAVTVPDAGWKYLDRARNWALTSGGKKIAVKVVKLANQKAIEIDLTKAEIAPGDYTLSAFWDWTGFEASGKVHVAELSDFKKAHLETSSQDHLLAKSGKTVATLEGGDFEFTTKVEMKKLHDEFATAEAVRFVLPKGLRKGPQDHMDVQIDSDDLDPGAYELLIAQQDGKPHAVEFRVLPSLPEIRNLPILVNQGSATQHFVLKGARLDLIAKLDAPGAMITLNPAGSDHTERSVTVELKSAPKPGTDLPVQAALKDRTDVLTFDEGIGVTGPLPVIASFKLSMPASMNIPVREGEFPAGYAMNALLDVKNIEAAGVLRLGCADGNGDPVVLHIGQETNAWNLERLSQDQLFLAFDTSALPAGCALEAAIDNGRDGKSQPVTLAHIIRVPRVDSFTVSAGNQYVLTGENLEMVDKLGWDADHPVALSGLPQALPGPGLRQSVAITLPDPPAPNAPLYVWLRGDDKGRASTIQAPAVEGGE